MLVVLVYDPLERDLTRAKNSVFGNHVYQLHIDDSTLQLAVEDRYAKHIEQLDTLGIPCVTLDASRDAIDDVLRYFSRLHLGR